MPSARTSRRGLLKGALAAAAAPLFVRASALGAAGRAAPSDRITMGFIGLGAWGYESLRAFMGYADVQAVAVCDVNARNRAAARAAVNRHYGGDSCAAAADYHAVTQAHGIDAVYIATPEHWHALPAISACQNRKDVYCEKPLSLTIREARAMADAARRYKRVFQTGSQQRSMPKFRHACELIRNGRIGKLQGVDVCVKGPARPCDLSPHPAPDFVDWDRWLGPAPYRPFHSDLLCYFWRHYSEFSGGGLTDWGAHHFDIVQWALDADGGGPVEIIPPGADGREHRKLTFLYAGGIPVTHTPERMGGITFRGGEGTIAIGREFLRYWPPSLAWERIGPDELHLRRSDDHRRNFLDCARSGVRPVADVEIGCRSVTVCHLANIAYQLGRPLKWDAAQETFPEDDEANRLLDRPKREPYLL
jgi:predicted dehydrogenase